MLIKKLRKWFRILIYISFLLALILAIIKYPEIKNKKDLYNYVGLVVSTSIIVIFLFVALVKYCRDDSYRSKVKEAWKQQINKPFSKILPNDLWLLKLIIPILIIIILIMIFNLYFF